MTDKMKNILKIAVFGAGVLVLLLLFSLMMRPQKWFDEKLIQNRDSRYIQITEQKENTIDVLNIGDSLSLSVFSPMELYRQQGFTGFNIGAESSTDSRDLRDSTSARTDCASQNPITT